MRKVAVGQVWSYFSSPFAHWEHLLVKGFKPWFNLDMEQVGHKAVLEDDAGVEFFMNVCADGFLLSSSVWFLVYDPEEGDA